MARFKKILAGTLAAAIMSGTLCVGASAEVSYPDVGSWELDTNPDTGQMSADIALNFYSTGYRAVITSKEKGVSSNYVEIFQGSTEKTVLTEVGVVCQPFSSAINDDREGNIYVQFTVKMSVGNALSDSAFVLRLMITEISR